MLGALSTIAGPVLFAAYLGLILYDALKRRATRQDAPGVLDQPTDDEEAA